MSIKISVIVNSFNVSDYITTTLASIYPQLTNDTELIIIDDGSTDATLRKIKETNLSNYNVKIIEMVDNKGISASRNYGISISNGKYILFIDGDDYIDAHMITVLLDIIKKHDVDIVGYNMEAVPDYNNGKSLTSREKKYVSDNFKEGLYSGNQLLNSLFKNELKHNPVTYLFKKNVFLDNNIVFPENINYGEDYATIYKYFNFVQHGLIVNKRLYKYVQRTDSVTHTPRIEYAKNGLQVSREILKYFENTNYFAGAKNYVIPRLITALGIAVRANKENSKVLIKEIESEIKVLSKRNSNLKEYMTINLRLKVCLNNLGLLKYIYYYRGIK